MSVLKIIHWQMLISSAENLHQMPRRQGAPHQRGAPPVSTKPDQGGLAHKQTEVVDRYVHTDHVIPSICSVGVAALLGVSIVDLIL